MFFRYYNSNPSGRTSVGDCTVRALSKALDVSWESAYAMLVKNGYQMSDMPSSNAVIGSVLRQHGFYRENLPPTCPDCYTVNSFCRDNPHGTYVVGTQNHVVCVKDGHYFDTWKSGDETVLYFWTK